MKATAFIIFFSVVFSVYSLLSYYIFIRGYQAISSLPFLKPWYSVTFILLSLTYLSGRFLERSSLHATGEVLTRLGTFWLAAFVYFLLLVIFIDLLRLINHFLPLLPEIVLANYGRFKLYMFIGAVGIVFITVLAGYINARNPKITRLNFTIDKVVQGKKSLHMVFASDIHLGTVIRKERLQNIIGKINGLKPDIIVFGGDVVDEDIAPVIRQNLGEDLLQLHAPLGVYTVTGNHEYIGGVEPAVSYLSEHGLQFLRDTAILIDGRFYLAGREDKDMTRFSGKPRKALHDILADVDKSLPIIMIDHQPFNLGKVAAEGVDFQLSGHTHDGQLWPFGYLTARIYELSHGYKKKENSHFYVSNGLGTWGPPVRTGNRPEIVDIVIEFK
jgi:predicted MPP superfamily phosphohydrolase